MSKNNHNPLGKVQMVTIPVWEYKDLIRTQAMMAITLNIINSSDGYGLKSELKAALALEDAEEEKE